MAYIASTEKDRNMQEILFDFNQENISRPLKLIDRKRKKWEPKGYSIE